MFLIKDVAEQAGVSVATVSLVLNDKPGVGPETRKRVQDTAERLGYTKTRTERTTARKGKCNIQFILYKKHGMVVADTAFFSHLLEGVEQQARQLGYNLLVSYVYEQQGVEEQLQSILNVGCAGIILLATEMLGKDLLPFIHCGLPLIVVDSYFEEPAVDTVVINNAQGAYLATRYLGTTGHKTIGHLEASVPINNFFERKYGYKKALKSLRIPYNKDYVFSLGVSVETAYQDMKQLLENGIQLPEALFADNDIIAVGAIKALTEAGIKIPEQLSVVGFDDVPLCEMLSPPLTTVRVEKECLGRLAVQRLAAQLNNPGEPLVKIEVHTELVKRGSALER